MSKATFTNQVDPTENPASGFTDLFVDSADKHLKTLDDAGTLIDLTGEAIDTLAEILAIGNTSGGTDLVISTGDVITITDAPTADTDGANKLYVDSQITTSNELSEVLTF